MGPEEGVDARAAMLAAAERLIAEHGMGAVSLRMVGAAAGQRNNSAAQYHFGSRDGLVNAIVETRLAPVNERRRQLLQALDRAGRGNDVRALVEALVVPLAEATLARPGSHYARFLAATFADPQWSAAAMRNPHGQVYGQWRRRLEQCLTDLPVVMRRVRIDLAVYTVIMALALWESGRGTRSLPSETLVADLVDTTVASLIVRSSGQPADAVSSTSSLPSVEDTRPTRKRAPTVQSSAG